MQQALIFREVLAEQSLLRHTLNQVQAKRKRHFQHFIGQSIAMQFVYDAIERCAVSSASVFITEPSDSGKELAADAIHTLSLRKDHPLICLNCAVTLAHNGTFFGMKSFYLVSQDATVARTVITAL